METDAPLLNPPESTPLRLKNEKCWIGQQPETPQTSGPPPNGVHERKNSRFGGFFGCMTVIGMIVTLFTLIFFVLIFLAVFKLGNLPSSGDSEPAAKEKFISGNPSGENKIAVIAIRGIIMPGGDSILPPANEWVSSGSVLKLIRAAKEDEHVKAILIDLDTPGGEVTASDEIYHALRACGKPVVAMMNSVAASGGYYIACAANRILANENTLTGSIGVIVQSYNYSVLLNLIGVKPHFYASGGMKTMLDGALPHKKETDPVVQTLVRNSYERFTSIVAKSRKIPLEKITSTEIGDGRVFDGLQALKLGLIDRTGYFEDAVSAAAEIAKLPENSFQVVRFTPRESFSDFLFSIASRCSGANRQSLRLELPGKEPDFRLKSNRLYFLPELF